MSGISGLSQFGVLVSLRKVTRVPAPDGSNANESTTYLAIGAEQRNERRVSFGPIAENHLRLGKPLVGELEGLWLARRGDYRVIYEIFEEDEIVLVHRVQHRRDVCRPR